MTLIIILWFVKVILMMLTSRVAHFENCHIVFIVLMTKSFEVERGGWSVVVV